MADPLPIPRRQALTLAANVLRQQSARLRDLVAADHRQGRLAGRTDAQRGAAAKAPGRLAQAARHEDDARRIGLLAGDDALCRGDGVDAAVVGYLLSWLGGWGDGYREMRGELAALAGREVLPERAGPDVCEVVRRVVCGG